MTELEECQRSLGKLYMVQWMVNRVTQFLTLYPETLNRTPVELRDFLADDRAKELEKQKEDVEKQKEEVRKGLLVIAKWEEQRKK